MGVRYYAATTSRARPLEVFMYTSATPRRDLLPRAPILTTAGLGTALRPRPPPIFHLASFGPVSRDWIALRAFPMPSALALQGLC